MNKNQRYKGFAAFKVNLDYQVSIPPHWRPEAGASLFLQFSIEQELPLVKVLSQQAYEEAVRRIIGSTKSPKTQGIKLDRLTMLSHKVRMNSRGKLRIPRDLCAQAGIAPKSLAILAGRGSHYEIWSMANFTTMLDLEHSQTEGEETSDRNCF